MLLIAGGNDYGQTWPVAVRVLLDLAIGYAKKEEKPQCPEEQVNYVKYRCIADG